MEIGVSDELLGTVMPIVVYWVYSGIYIMFGSYDEYRLHSKKDEDEKNVVTKSTVVKGVLLQQFVQAIVAIILFKPFFVVWDRIFGTYMPYALEKRTGGGLVSRPAKEYKES